MESRISAPAIMTPASSADTVDASPEQAESALRAELEQRLAWAQDQFKIHASAARAAESIIRTCEAALSANVEDAMPQEPDRGF